MRAATDAVDRSFGPHLQDPAAFKVGFANLFTATDEAARRKIRARDDLEQLFDFDFGFAQQGDRCVNNLRQIVRWNFRGHADRNSF